MSEADFVLLAPIILFIVTLLLISEYVYFRNSRISRIDPYCKCGCRMQLILSADLSYINRKDGKRTTWYNLIWACPKYRADRYFHDHTLLKKDFTTKKTEVESCD